MIDRADTHAALESAIFAYADCHLDSNEIITDAVLLLASQYIDEDGDRCGRVFVFPRHGYQPVYITKGMLTQALDLVRHTEANS